MKHEKPKSSPKRLGKETKQYKKKKKLDELDQLIRLNKFISDAGYTSRRKADELIEAGRVTVGGKIVKGLGTKVRKGDNVRVDGDSIGYEEKHVYYILNKPKDTITTTEDQFNRKTVMDIVKVRRRVYPVGRLDRNSTGALILTNDGELANRLTHPSYEIERIYKVKLDKKLEVQHARQIANGGVDLDGEITAPCEIFIDPKHGDNLTMSMYEGKNREIRRIFEKFGYFVKKLDRKSYGCISNSGMARGEYRQLNKNEITALRKLVGLR
ncbi:MAG: rRNA pseudouridine synthase [Ignavibacteriae bacterium]|nr:rRNA pseudouridine synthase [Ignavibacteriota bacterium]MCB9221103.1 rRNA pseudouridine synthase [Ignavibacteria bacterium]